MIGGDPRRISASAPRQPKQATYALHVLAIDQWLDDNPEPMIG